MGNPKPKLSLRWSPDRKSLIVPNVSRTAVIARIIDLEECVRWNHLNHKINSRYKWLGVSQLDQCSDVSKLTSYALRLRSKLDSQPEPEPEPPTDPTETPERDIDDDLPAWVYEDSESYKLWG